MRQAPTGFVAPGATWTEVSREGMVFGEGVVSAPNGMVYFSSMTRALPPGPDNPGGTIFRFDPATGQTTKYLEPSGMSNGLHVDRNGDLLIAQDSGGEGKGGGRAVMRRNLATGAMSVVADRYQGKRFNGPNDLTSDAKGRIYFTDARYGGTGADGTAERRVPRRSRRQGHPALRPTSSGRTASKSHRTANDCTSRPPMPNPCRPTRTARPWTNSASRWAASWSTTSTRRGSISNGRLFYRNDATDGRWDGHGPSGQPLCGHA